MGLIGSGAIGTVIAKNIALNKKLKLVSVFDISEEMLQKLKKNIQKNVQTTTDISEFLKNDFDLVIEAASQVAVRNYGKIILKKSDLLLMSVGALEDDRLKSVLVKTAEKNKRKIIIPTGAVAGIDGIKSASMDKLYEVRLVTTKNPKSLERDDKTRTVLFEGSARDAAKKFPKNLNVCATLSLAGIGMDKTKVTLVSDPAVDKNTHEIFVRGAFGNFSFKIENLPSKDNPKTSYLAALSAVKTINQLAEPLKIGT